MIQTTNTVVDSTIWEIMTGAVADSSDNTRMEYVNAETAFRRFQYESAGLIVQLREQINLLQSQIVTENAHAVALSNSFDAKVTALNGQVNTATQLFNQVKETNQQLNAQIASVSADNSTIQGRINYLISPAGQTAVTSKPNAYRDLFGFSW